MERKRRILVVEDTPALREALCSILASDGFEVFCCNDGASALAAAAHDEFDIIITDYHMPNMNGVDATRNLRIRFPQSIIIGLSFDDKGEDFLLAGADAFLFKPYKYDDLIKLLTVSK
jgi:CheY-like chemotaxis protein